MTSERDGGPKRENEDSNTVNEDFRSLMEGLRTTLPGVQIITAFLLTLPLQSHFEDLVTAERIAYYVAFASALISSLLLMAPSSHQRLRAAEQGTVARHSPHHLAVAVRVTNLGTTLFAVAMVAVAYLISSVLFVTPVAIAFTVLVAAVCAWTWFYQPLVAFDRED